MGLCYPACTQWLPHHLPTHTFLHATWLMNTFDTSQFYGCHDSFHRSRPQSVFIRAMSPSWTPFDTSQFYGCHDSFHRNRPQNAYIRAMSPSWTLRKAKEQIQPAATFHLSVQIRNKERGVGGGVPQARPSSYNGLKFPPPPSPLQPLPSRSASFLCRRVIDSATHCTIMRHTETHCNTLQHTSIHCSILRHTATHCHTLQHTVTHWDTLRRTVRHCNTLQHTATHCSTLWYTAAHCITLQHIATHCNTLRYNTNHCNTLNYIATHCNTLQHTPTHSNTLQDSQWPTMFHELRSWHVCVMTLQQTAKHSNTRQYTWLSTMFPHLSQLCSSPHPHPQPILHMMISFRVRRLIPQRGMTHTQTVTFVCTRMRNISTYIYVWTHSLVSASHMNTHRHIHVRIAPCCDCTHTSGGTRETYTTARSPKKGTAG